MFHVFRRSQPRDSTIRLALVNAGFSAASDRTRVAVLEHGAQYSGRRVTFFRAFEPGHQDVLLASGHVERDGVVMVNRLREPPDYIAARVPANRANHADDERIVFWDADSARVAEATLPAPTAAWRNTQSSLEDQP
jgi:hypothetical protein